MRRNDHMAVSEASRQKIAWGPGGFHNLIHKKARIWVTATAVLAAAAIFIMGQVVSVALRNDASYSGPDLYNTSEAAALKDRFGSRGSALSRVISAIGNALSSNPVQQNDNTTTAIANPVVTPGGGRPSGGIPAGGIGASGPSTPSSGDAELTGGLATVAADDCYLTLGQKFGDNVVFNSTQEWKAALNARDQAYYNSVPNYPGPRQGPGAPTMPVNSPFNGVTNMFGIQNEQVSFTTFMASVAGLDNFTVINPQGGIAEKFQRDFVIAWGNGKTGGPGIYDTPGHYMLKARAWYKCNQLLAAGSPDVHGRTGVYAQPTVDQNFKHVPPASPISSFPVTIADAKYKGWTLAGPDLLLKNQDGTTLTSPGRRGNLGKDAYYKPPADIDVAGIELVNIGSSPITVSKIAFNDTSNFTRQSDEKVLVKRNGIVIGTLNWPLLRNNDVTIDPETQSRVEAMQKLKIGVITLSTPLVIAPGATESLVLNMHIVPATWNGTLIKADLPHQVCFNGFETTGQSLPSELKGQAGGRNTTSPDGGKTRVYTFAPGCGEPFIMRNNPDKDINDPKGDAGN